MTGWKIHHKLLLLALGPALLVAAALDAYFIYAGFGALDAELRGRGQATARYLAPASEYGVISGNRNSLQALVLAAMKESDAQAVLIIDAAGHTLAASGRMGLGVGEAIQAAGVIEGRGWLGFNAAIRRSSVDFDDFQERPRDALGQSSDIIGHVHVELSTAGLQERRSALLFAGLGILLAVLALAAALALRIALSVSRPVGRLVDAVDAMASGQLAARVAESSAGELAMLERGFNQMAEKLEDASLTLHERIEHATAQLAHQARHDSLTGLINRREFEVRVEHALTSARAGEAEHAVCFLDLDQFKIVNDTCGHAAGDELLRQISHLLKARVRGSDTMARLGGDEFGVLLVDCSLEDAQHFSENLRRMVEEFRFSWRDRVFVIGVSIGLVLITRDSRSLVEVLSAADQACYTAKDKGRNRIQVFQLADRELVERRGEMSWAVRITDALNEERLLLYAQRITPLNPGANPGVHFEVLLRMLDEHGAIVLPRAFLPAAERYELMTTIDRWVIASACSAIRRCLDQGAGTPVLCAVNLSAHSVHEAGMLAWIGGELRRYKVPPGCLCIEISEAVASQNFAETTRFAHGLREIGCSLALDDFGSGMASFSYLKSLPINFVKVDGRIVREVVESSLSQTLVRAIHEISSNMGVRVIAESVESEQVLAVLCERGIEYGQGNYFDMPMPLDDWLQLEALRLQEHGAEGKARIIPFHARDNGASSV